MNVWGAARSESGRSILRGVGGRDVSPRSWMPCPSGANHYLMGPSALNVH